MKMEKVNKTEVDHGLETMTEATKALFSEVGTMGKDLSWFRKNWKKVKKILDKNKDGKIQVKELANPWFLKIVLANFAAIMVQIVLMTVIIGVTGGGWSWGTILIGLSTILGPFFIGLLNKFVVDDYDNRLKEKDNGIDGLHQKIKLMEIDKVNEQNKHNNEIHQIEMALELKKQYIELFCKPV